MKKICFVTLCFIPSVVFAVYDSGNSTVTITSDYLEYNRFTGELKASGSVNVQQDTMSLVADQLQANPKSGDYHATGNVRLNDGKTDVWGSEIIYNINGSTGTVLNGGGKDPPWAFAGKQIEIQGKDRITFRHGYLTSCDASPPHYKFAARQCNYQKSVRATAYNGLFFIGDVPLFYTPVYTRSLEEGRYNIDIKPGHNARDGVTNKLIYGYPLTPHTYTKLYWDYFQRTGNGFGLEYNYFLPEVKGSFYGYEVNDHNPDPAPNFRRWNVRYAHWQKLAAKLSVQSNVNFQSDESFNNLFLKDSFERVISRSIGLKSDAALTYQMSWATSRLFVSRLDKVRPATGKLFADTLVVPSLSLASPNLKLRNTGYFYNFSANFSNTFNGSEGFYRQNVGLDSRLSRDMRISRVLTLKPSLGFSESWLDRSPVLVADTKSVLMTRFLENTNLRWRAARMMDVDFTHTFTARSMFNKITRDVSAKDRGIEANNLGIFSYMRPNILSSVRFSTSVDLRRAARNTPAQFESLRSRIAPLTMDINFNPKPGLDIFFRESYAVFTPGTGARRPNSTLFEIHTRKADTYFTTTMSNSSGKPGAVNLGHTAGFYLTDGWRLDGTIRYEVSGPGRTNFNRVQPIEEKLNVVRDLHCWEARMEMLRREPKVSEVFFRIQLKADMASKKKLYHTDSEKEFYPWR